VSELSAADGGVAGAVEPEFDPEVEPAAASEVDDESVGPRLWAALACSRRGASHVRGDIGCQDHSAAEVIDDASRRSDAGLGTWAFAVVADGHGGVRHFRSQFGAVHAVEAMTSAFLTLRKRLVAPAVAAGGTEDADPLGLKLWKATAARLVVTEWRTFVYQHLCDAPPDERAPEPGLVRMLDHVRERHGGRNEQRLRSQVTAFRHWSRDRGESTGSGEPVEGRTTTPLPLPSDPGWPRKELGSWHAAAYGATLLGVLVGPGALYWLRIGDGAMVQIVDGEAVEISPVPDDAIANETPSLSDDRAVVQAEVGAVPLVDGMLPSAVVLATDGVPNSYLEPRGFLEFCEEVARRAAADRAGVDDRMPHWLDELSQRGSGDDMSVAMTWMAGSPTAGTTEENTGSGRDDSC